jgi:hypothetical protein
VTIKNSALASIALGASLLSFGAIGAVLPVTATNGSTFTFDMNGFFDSGGSPAVINGLSALVTLNQFLFTSTTVNGAAATQVQFNYSIVNDSAVPVLTSRVSNLAFNTTPNILVGGTNSVTGVFGTMLLGANQPNGIGTVELCLTAQNCPGGGSGGVTRGNTGGGSVTLTFAGLLSSLTFDSLFVRYQSITCAAGAVCSSSASGTAVPVPAPGPLALAGVLALGGLASWGITRRRRPALQVARA